MLERLIKNHENTEDAAVRTAYGVLSSCAGIAANALLFAGKLAVGIISGSVAITADAVNNLSDASSSVISLLGFRLAGRPADEEHPYGHGRYEYLSGLMVAILIIVIGVELVKTSFDKILHPSEVEFSLVTAAVLLASIGVKLWMMAFNRRIGRKIDSKTLIATAADSRNDVISTSAVLISSVVSY